MKEARDNIPIYVVDTNILVDYVDIIPCCDGTIAELDEPTIDLSGSHIVIPTAVVRELSKFKKESSERGKAARVILKRIRALSEMTNRNMIESYNLNHPIHVGNQMFSVMPVHKSFNHSLPFNPSDDDMDGQIILATLAVMYRANHYAIDGSIDYSQFENHSQPVILLTNDNGLATRANVRGIKTSRFGYKQKPIYTGRRDLIVPRELFELFLYGNGLTLEEWEELMPNEPKLVANEFIVMYPKDYSYPGTWDESDDEYFHNIGRYDAESERIVTLDYASRFPGKINSPGQAIYADALMNPDISLVVATGPAGCGKTYMSTIYGYQACKDGQFLGTTVVPCYTDKGQLGALPGDLDEKLNPDIAPIKDALFNYLIDTDKDVRKKITSLEKYGTKRTSDDSESSAKSLKNRINDQVDLIYENWFENIYIENARGHSFRKTFIIYDEFQDQNSRQADTLLKRIGEDSKIVITGDVNQIHAAYNDHYNNGITYAVNLLKGARPVAMVNFLEEEIIRHPLVKFIAERQKHQKS